MGEDLPLLPARQIGAGARRGQIELVGVGYDLRHRSTAQHRQHTTPERADQASLQIARQRPVAVADCSGRSQRTATVPSARSCRSCLRGVNSATSRMSGVRMRDGEPEAERMQERQAVVHALAAQRADLDPHEAHAGRGRVRPAQGEHRVEDRDHRPDRRKQQPAEAEREDAEDGDDERRRRASGTGRPPRRPGTRSCAACARPRSAPDAPPGRTSSSPASRVVVWLIRSPPAMKTWGTPRGASSLGATACGRSISRFASLSAARGAK